MRPASALGSLVEPLGAGSDCLLDLSCIIIVELVNPAMALESVDDPALFRGANLVMVGGELLQFGVAEPVGPATWRLSRLLRGRAGTEAAMVHSAGAPFILLDDPALLVLPEAIAGLAEGGEAVLQWVPRGGTSLTEIAFASVGQALRPLAPAHGQIRPGDDGGVTIEWIRRSRVDTGWCDHVDQPLGESREAWRIALAPSVPGLGPWERTSSALVLDAGEWAAIPPGRVLEIRQVGDFALSPPLSLPLT